MPLESGFLLRGRYRIQRLLGRGGMSTVHLATDENLDVLCAVKENLVPSAEAEQQFKREATLLATLRHPHLPRVTNHFIFESGQYLVMDYVPGEDLHERLQRLGPLPIAEALHVAHQICDALEYLHRHTPAIVHRDIKPANLKLTPEGKTMLVDFGIAKTNTAGQKTATGAVGLTPGFAPPEQYGLSNTDPRTDQYALAATLFMLFTGATPPDSVDRLMERADLPDLTRLRPEMAPQVAHALTRALELKPEQRFDDITAFKRALLNEPLALAPTPAVARPSILLVDDDVFNRDGVRLYLTREGFEVWEAGDEETAWQLAAARTPNAALVDISIPPDPRTPSRSAHSFGLHLAQRLKNAYPALGLVLFSAYEDRGREVLDMVRDGVRGLAYKLKGCQPNALLVAIQDTLAGRVVIDPEVRANPRDLAEELLQRLTPNERQWVENAVANFRQLTPREREIANRLAASHNTEGIAQALSVTPKTAENYIGHVYDKLRLNEMGREAPHLRKVVVLAKACMVNDLRGKA